MKTIKPALWCVLLCCLAAPAALGQFSVRFDQPRYEIVPGQTFQAQVLLDPAPAAGLSSYGVQIGFPSAHAQLIGPASVTVPPLLDFNGVRGPGSVKFVGSDGAGVKGTVDFFVTPPPIHRGALLANFTLEDRGLGPYLLRLLAFNTLGPTEQIFVDGVGAVLDLELTFGTAEVVYREPEAAHAIFAGEPNLKKKKVIYFKGRDNTVTGRIHSNSDIKVRGKGHVFRNGSMEYVTGFDPVPSHRRQITFENSSLVKSSVKPYPVNFVLSDFAPGGSMASAAQAVGKYYYIRKKDTHLDEFITGHVLREGLYYVEGKVKLDDHKATRGRVTIVATGEIEIKSKDAVFESYTGCLLAFSGLENKDYKKRAIKLSGKNSRWQGIVFAPGGLVEISGSTNADEWGDDSDKDDDDDPPDDEDFETANATLLGALIGRSVRVNAKNFQIIGMSANACPRLISPLRPVMRRGQLQISFPTILGFTYAVEYTDSLTNPLWRLWTTVDGNGGIVTLEAPREVPTRFYRLRLL